MAENPLAELPEDRATGTIAVIYDEIRRFSGGPYVSSLQRCLATMPGVLEWAWAAIRPAMAELSMTTPISVLSNLERWSMLSEPMNTCARSTTTALACRLTPEEVPPAVAGCAAPGAGSNS